MHFPSYYTIQYFECALFWICLRRCSKLCNKLATLCFTKQNFVSKKYPMQIRLDCVRPAMIIDINLCFSYFHFSNAIEKLWP